MVGNAGNTTEEGNAQWRVDTVYVAERETMVQNDLGVPLPIVQYLW